MDCKVLCSSTKVAYTAAGQCGMRGGVEQDWWKAGMKKDRMWWGTQAGYTDQA